MENYKPIIVRSEQITIRTLNTRLEQKYGALEEITIPDFQRKSNQWSLDKQNTFISNVIQGSTLLIQPIVVGLIQNTKGSYLLDGYQRVSTVKDFLSNKLTINYNNKRIKREDLTQDELDSFLNTQISVTTVSNIENMNVAFDLFKRINSGVPLTKFQSIKGYTELSDLCKLISDDDNIRNLILKLKLATTSRSYDKKNNTNKIDQAILSAVCMAENMELYSSSKAMSSQWEVHYKKDNNVLDNYSAKYLDPTIWYKIYKQVDNVFDDGLGKTLGSSESRI